MKRFIVCSLLIWSIFCFAGPLSLNASEKAIPVLSYYDFGPFVTGENQGFAYEFVRLLNKHAAPKFKFQLKHWPRKRIDIFLKTQQGAVLFVNPKWMKDIKKEKYLWTPTFLTDRNEVISRADRKIVFNGADSLKGLKLGGILGRKYHGLEEAFVRGDIIREDVRYERQNLKKVISGRIDVTTQPMTVAKYLIRDMGLKGKFFFSPTPLHSSTRHILVTGQLGDVHEFLSEFVRNLSDNSEWKNIVRRYELQ
ncbi:transporter substrate-binding domain-containing protein [Desulfobacterales bacterium HSG2]|nr:transporter substrate-binding domain-containing protein [Desulfobacterales bacterium HSG2]